MPVIVGFEIRAIKNIQSIIRTNPNMSISVLKDIVDMTVGKFILQAIKFIRISLDTCAAKCDKKANYKNLSIHSAYPN